MSTPSKPIVLSWNTCDGVHVDPSTGKYYLMGVFSGIRAGQFPATHPRMFWFLILTELSEGEHTLKISMGLPAEEPVLTAERSFQAQNPLQRVHLVNEIKNARFERPDNYAVTIEVDNDPILVTNFPVSQ